VTRLIATLLILALAYPAYGARGFTTDGAGTTDSIATTLTAHSATRTYACWTWITGTGGGGGFGRLLYKGTSGAQVETISSASGAIRFSRTWTGNGTWEVTAPATGSWTHLLVTYDSGATSNDPVFYFNGVSQSLTADTNPTGTVVNDSEVYILGNRPDGTRNWDGRLAECATWDRILTAGEITAVGAKNFSPSCFRSSLVEYLPLVRDVKSLVRGAVTLTGTAVQAHPRVIQCH
jgi:hypothetical protein